jgi:glycerol-3-phosphate responsive antiterminator
MDKEQLKERLLVAEILMKKIFNRNKELEEYHEIKMKSGKENEFVVFEEMNRLKGICEELKKKEKEMIVEIDEKNKEIEKLRSENENLK